MRTERLRYVAIGDSFSEGVGDDEGAGGWTRRLAQQLSPRRRGRVAYANLAVRGRLLGPILDEQLPAALALSPTPTLVSICGGGNDMLRPRFDVPALAARLGDAVARCLAVGARPVLVSPADPSAGLPMGGLIHHRGDRWATAMGEVADRYGVPFVDVSRDVVLRRSAFWSADRLHMNALGHARVAARVRAALAREIPPADEPEIEGAARTWRDDLRYFGDYVVPWIGRRLRGESSGDGRTGPQPGWVALRAVAAH